MMKALASLSSLVLIVLWVTYERPYATNWPGAVPVHNLVTRKISQVIIIVNCITNKYHFLTAQLLYHMAFFYMIFRSVFISDMAFVINEAINWIILLFGHSLWRDDIPDRILLKGSQHQQSITTFWCHSKKNQGCI